MTTPHTYITTTIPYEGLYCTGCRLLGVPARGPGWRLGHPGARRRQTSGARLDAALGVLLEACQVLGRELSPFLPDAAARITAQCTPGENGRLPSPSPVFRRLTSGGGHAPGR
jgi:hypothetical protein